MSNTDETRETSEDNETSEAPPLSTNTVSIEPNHESEILEIRYDGSEIYKE